jgi:hypothetical protein
MVEDRLGEGVGGLEKSLAAKEIPAVAVGHSQGLTVDPVPRAELALKVRRPDPIREPSK